MAVENISTDFKTLENVYKIAKEKKLKKVTFEFIVGSCFPNICENIKKEIQLQHAQGYAEGLKDAKS